MIEVPYTLAGREIPGLAACDQSELPPAPCIFCARLIQHVNDGGSGWLLGAVVNGESRAYLQLQRGPVLSGVGPMDLAVRLRRELRRERRRPLPSVPAVAERGRAVRSRRMPDLRRGPLARRPAGDRQRTLPVVHRRTGLPAGAVRACGRGAAGDPARRRVRRMRSSRMCRSRMTGPPIRNDSACRWRSRSECILRGFRDDHGPQVPGVRGDHRPATGP